MVVWALFVKVARFFCQQRLLNTFPWPGYFRFEDGVVWLWHSLVSLYICLSSYSSNPLTLELIGRDDGLRTLCHIWWFACQKRVVKTFPDPGYLHRQDGLVWLWHSLVNLYIWLTISSSYSPIPFTLGLNERNGGSSSLCHSCRFACQHRVLKTFSGPGYLCCEDEVVWLRHSLLKLYIWLTISSFFSCISFTLGSIGSDPGLSTICHNCWYAGQQGVLRTFPGPPLAISALRMGFPDYDIHWQICIYGLPFYLSTAQSLLPSGW